MVDNAVLEPTPTGALIPMGCFKGRCFYDSATLILTWHEAARYCRANGLFLSSVAHSKEEMDFFLRTHSNYIHPYNVRWVGATDAALFAEFRWIDGSPWDYDLRWVQYGTKAGSLAITPTPETATFRCIRLFLDWTRLEVSNCEMQYAFLCADRPSA